LGLEAPEADLAVVESDFGWVMLDSGSKGVEGLLTCADGVVDGWGGHDGRISELLGIVRVQEELLLGKVESFGGEGPGEQFGDGSGGGDFLEGFGEDLVHGGGVGGHEGVA
jgi:hypothetical protein